MEIWQPIINFEDKYEISSDGKVKSKSRYSKTNNRFSAYKQTINEKILKQKINNYAEVCLFSNGKRKWCYVHRLVAAAFIPNPENKPQVNHKNGNPLDNRVENLEWSTCSENIMHSFKILNKKSNFINYHNKKYAKTN